MASNKPRQAEAIPFKSWDPETPEIIVREKKIKVKTSAGPNFNAKLAKIPAKRIREIFEIKSATQDE